MEIDNNNNNQDSDPDDPTLELEPLSETACDALLQAEDASARRDTIAEPCDPRKARFETRAPTPDDMASEVQRLREELKFRADMNSILRHCNDQLRDKCDGLEEQVSSLLKTSEMLRKEQERSRQGETLASGEAAPDPREKPVSDRQEPEQHTSSGAMRSAPTRSPRPRPVPGSEVQERLVLLGADGIETDTWILNDGINTIGSGPDCNIRIQSSFVSRHHAQLIRTKTRSILEDLNSTNGTYINARRINKLSIRPGDLITVGKQRLEYRKSSVRLVGARASGTAFKPHSG